VYKPFKSIEILSFEGYHRIQRNILFIVFVY